MPTHVFSFSSFPLNVNGKIDQRSLFASMIGRLRALEVDEELESGITVFDLKVKNTAYAIEPVTAMVDHLASAVGFKQARTTRIRLAVEEMLTERIMDANLPRATSACVSRSCRSGSAWHLATAASSMSSTSGATRP